VWPIVAIIVFVPVSLTPVANLPPASLIPVANVLIIMRFITGVVDTGSKFATSAVSTIPVANLPPVTQ
jgi:hypothetical protein